MSESKLRKAARALVGASWSLDSKARCALECKWGALRTALDAAPEVGEWNEAVEACANVCAERVRQARARNLAARPTDEAEKHAGGAALRRLAAAECVLEAQACATLILALKRPAPPPADDAVARAREAFTVAARAHCRAQVALEQRPFSNFLDTETRAAQSEVVRRNVDQMAAYDALLAAEARAQGRK